MADQKQAARLAVGMADAVTLSASVMAERLAPYVYALLAARDALATICDIGETRDVRVAETALAALDKVIGGAE